MGIELPSELSGVAATAGVQWPQADEDAMRASAQAYRQAGTKLSTVATSADGSAAGALKSISGSTADAAQQHWNTFVSPDNGHFTATVQGCNAAADRLEHAADQVSAAKVQIVGHLVGLAKTSDAAEQAASAGHPTAMLGLDTAIRGTAANVANVNSSLTKSIRLDSGQTMDGVTPPANVTPGTGGHGLFGSAVDSATGLGQTALHTGGGAVDNLAGAGQGVLHAGGGAVGDLSQTAVHAGGGAVGDVSQTALHTGGGAVDNLAGAGQGAMHAGGGAVGDLTGMGQGAVHQGVGAVDGLTGGAAAPVDQAAQSTLGGVGGGADAGLQQTGQQVGGWGHDVGQQVGNYGGGYGGGSGYQGGLPIPGGHGSGGYVPGPGENTGPIQIPPAVGGGGGGPAMPVSGWTHGGGGGVGEVNPGVPTPPLGTVQQSAAAAPVMDVHQAAPPTGFAAPQVSAAPPQAPGFTAAPTFDAPLSGGAGAGFAGGGIPAGGSSGAVAGGGSGWSAGSASAAPVQRYGSSSGGPDVIAPVNVPQGGSASARRGLAPGARSAAANQEADTGPTFLAPKVHKPANRQDPVVALFLVHMFPIGHLPVASSHPMRQLPAPPREHDFASGLYFGPGDHPRSDLIRVEPVADPPEIGPGLPADHPAVAELLTGYDPLAGENELDWDRRYLARPAEEGASAEYVWPPGEVFPEGGCDTAEAEVLDEGTLIDRFGTPEGRVFAESGTPFGRRALPPDAVDSGYARYRVLRPIPVWRTLSAAWFGQSGAGVRYRATFPAADLVTLGYLAEEPIEAPVDEPTKDKTDER